MIKTHSFHVPVMGTGFTIDTPLKLSQYGIDSVISLGDDLLLEKLRKVISSKFNVPYEEISQQVDDYRAKRITCYLNLLKDIAEQNFEEIKHEIIEKDKETHDYFSFLPDCSSIKQEFKNFISKCSVTSEIKKWINSKLYMGSIDVNIMTKIDKDKFHNGEKLSTIYNDAHASLRGYANSKLNSSIILSAGMNPRLYGYLEQFEDFYPDKNGQIKKKIVLKVSDYRSAYVQGKFLARKGLWVSEYRIESGLNCGGHAFATEGYLMGPILKEFRENKESLRESIYEIFVNALSSKNKLIPNSSLPLKITAQGGVGTSAEHEFLLDYYNVDSVGWGTPFLLVPQATNVDEQTLKKLVEAKEDDLYLSNISPLGVPFNNLRDNSKDLEKMDLAQKGKPGSPCFKNHLSFNTEYSSEGLCTASRKFQILKLQDLEKENLTKDEYKKRYNEIIEKTCLCVGLGASVLLTNNIQSKDYGEGASICPGPNLAYFSKTMSLKEIIDHIYGRTNSITRTDRPNMFINELKLYIDYLKNKLEETRASMNSKQEKYLLTFSNNLKDGLNYYYSLFSDLKGRFEDSKITILNELDHYKTILHNINLEIEKLCPAT